MTRVSHVVGAPLIEIHYVRIHAPGGTAIDSKCLEVYGVVQVTNGKDNTFYVYNQPESDPDMFFFHHGSGDLYLMDGGPIPEPFPTVKVYVHLTDKSNGIKLADGTCTLDYTNKKISLEDHGKLSFSCENYTVTVGYTTFEAAVVAYIDLELYKKNDVVDDDDGNVCRDVVVAGDVTACCDSDYSFAKNYSSSLLSPEKRNPSKVKPEAKIQLDKSIVAVPVYSTLVIQISLRDIVDGYTIHPARHVGIEKEQIKGPSGYLVNVRIQWRRGHPRKEMEQLQLETRVKLIADVHSPSVLWKYREPTERICSMESMEVFSMIILPDEKKNQEDALYLYGKVAVDSVPGEVYLFKRDKSSPELFRRGECKMLMIEGPHEHCFTGSRLGVRLKLKDIQGHVFCKGYIDWDEVLLGDGYDFSWWDWRLCSIIEGDYGLVKVHYSVFSDAVRATVVILFSFDYSYPEFSANVHGSIFASYGDYEYSPYDEDYYRSVLFLKSEKCPLELTKRRKIKLPLLKSVISVPRDSSLLIEIDLFPSTIFKKHDVEALKGVAEFEFGVESCWRRRTDDFFIDVLVDWG